MSRPIIGITGELEAARWGSWVREAVLSPVSYVRAVERAGGAPVVLPPVPPDSVPSLIEGMDGLLFTGGRDIDPALYDEQRRDETDPPNHRRDRFELALLRAAIDADLPFLAICRGLHLLNVARGGTLIQHLPDKLGHDAHQPDPVKLTPHEIQLSGESRLGRLLGPSIAPLASHHQGLNRVGSGLLEVGWAARDQLVEAVELTGHRFGIGVQWHPQESDDTRLVAALVVAAAGAAAAGAGAAGAGTAGARKRPPQSSAVSEGSVSEGSASKGDVSKGSVSEGSVSEGSGVPREPVAAKPGKRD